MQISMFSLEERPASLSVSPDSVREWMIRAATWPSSILDLLHATGPVGWFGKTCPASCPATEDGILVPFSGAWGNSGMGSPTECLTLNMSEWTASLVPSRNADAVCSLSDILETAAVPARYYLSRKACAGILRRAEKRGKVLPPQLAHALKAVAD